MKKSIGFLVFILAFMGIWLQAVSVYADTNTSATVSTTTSASTNMLAYQTQRISGGDRIDTSIQTANTGWATGAPTVLLADQNDYADALSAVPLSKQLNAPILLTNGASLDSRITSELQALHTTKVILLGGTGVLTSNVEEALNSMSITTQRIGGADRYETSALIAAQVPGDSVVIVNGENFPDALTAAPYAGVKGIPILLTRAAGMPSSIQSLLNTRKPQHVIVVGGTGVVPDSTLQNITVENRIGGLDRYETAVKMYQFEQSTLSNSAIYLATGEDFPDAMVGAALAAKNNAPLLLTETDNLPPSLYSTLSALPTQQQQSTTIVLLGGTGVITSKVEQILQGKVSIGSLLAGKTIAIDPGHGTPDTGAIGPTGTEEKNNTLAIGLDLRAILEANGANVVMTRSTDSAPTGSSYTEVSDLQKRVDIATQAHADIFISIHNDSFSSPDAHGTSTWYSNASNVHGQGPASQKLAQDLQKEVVKALGTYDRGTDDSRLYVTRNATMPAALVEVAFISNPTEEKELASSAFREKAAQGIYQGILDYFFGSSN